IRHTRFSRDWSADVCSSDLVTYPLEKPVVLVTDDEPVLRELIARWLTNNGYRPLQAGNAAEAWQRLQENEVHLVTLDVSMPGERTEERRVGIGWRNRRRSHP